MDKGSYIRYLYGDIAMSGPKNTRKLSILTNIIVFVSTVVTLIFLFILFFPNVFLEIRHTLNNYYETKKEFVRETTIKKDGNKLVDSPIPTSSPYLNSKYENKNKSNSDNDYTSKISRLNPGNSPSPTISDINSKLKSIESQIKELQSQMENVTHDSDELKIKQRNNYDIRELQSKIYLLWFSFILAIFLIIIMFGFIIFMVYRIVPKLNRQEMKPEYLEEGLNNVDNKPFMKSEPIMNEKKERIDYVLNEFRKKESTDCTVSSGNYRPVMEPIESKNTLSMEEYTLKFIQHYNNTTQADDKWSFEDRYKPMRMGLNTSHDVFEPRSDGDYWAIDISNYASNKFFIVPRFMPFDSNLYNAGGMGRVFNCIGYDPNYRFNHVVLVKPAVFLKAENAWRMKCNGQLRLEQGELIS
jgi:hypothetical protein